MTVTANATASGYPESFLPTGRAAAAAAAPGGVTQQQQQPYQLPPEQLRIQLRQEVQEQQQHEDSEVDAYNLARCVGVSVRVLVFCSCAVGAVVVTRSVC